MTSRVGYAAPPGRAVERSSGLADGSQTRARLGALYVSAGGVVGVAFPPHPSQACAHPSTSACRAAALPRVGFTTGALARACTSSVACGRSAIDYQFCLRVGVDLQWPFGRLEH